MVPVIGAIVAVITGHMAKGQIRRTGEQGDTYATVGLVLGYIHLAVVALLLGVRPRWSWLGRLRRDPDDSSG